MTQISVSVKNLASVLSRWKLMPKRLTAGIAQSMQSTGVFASAKVKEVITAGTGMWKSPVDTGAMRRGIQPSGMSIFAPKIYIRPSSATPYATYVHEGTRRMRARPFFTITKSMKEREIRDFFEKDLRRIISDL